MAYSRSRLRSGCYAGNRNRCAGCRLIDPRNIIRKLGCGVAGRHSVCCRNLGIKLGRANSVIVCIILCRALCMMDYRPDDRSRASRNVLSNSNGCFGGGSFIFRYDPVPVRCCWCWACRFDVSNSDNSGMRGCHRPCRLSRGKSSCCNGRARVFLRCLGGRRWEVSGQISHTDKLHRVHSVEARQMLLRQTAKPFRLVFQSPFRAEHGSLRTYPLRIRHDF